MHDIANQCRNSDDSDGGPSLDYIGIAKSKEFSPFNSKKVCRESDTPHSKLGNDCNESENIKIPGDIDEMQRFSDDAMKCSKIQITLHLPVVSLQLK